jgi:hypothetical protein
MLASSRSKRGRRATDGRQQWRFRFTRKLKLKHASSSVGDSSLRKQRCYSAKLARKESRQRARKNRTQIALRAVGLISLAGS